MSENFLIFDINSEDNLRKTEISFEIKLKIENLNIISDSEKESISDLYTKCRHLVGGFNHIEVLTTRLENKQKELSLEKRVKLIQDVKTRWKSTFDMIESIIFNKDALISLSIDPLNKT